MAEGDGDLQALRGAASVVAELEVLEGRPEAAVSRLARHLDRAGLQEYDVTALLPVLAWAQLEQGQLDQAAVTVGQAIARARPENARIVLVDALRVQGLVAIHQQRWAAAEGNLEEGVALARSLPYPYAEARLLHAYGQLHSANGRPERARDSLEAALVTFKRLGAREDARRTARALAGERHGPARSPDASTRE